MFEKKQLKKTYALRAGLYLFSREFREKDINGHVGVCRGLVYASECV